ncbi:hypothetical protein PR202_ga09495 [Eleusine coracana subsp. coracana]|uniref:Uncharacterized protein n=1 Tax=Eleusine coracana subsp. coracana TaxID=191504 RepID=A0AAV5C363_ELECO|nr:hypothetical protein PR202_ga09495 [Eleusine coracana subsp. coracana]
MNTPRSSTASTSPASSATSTDIKAPLWDHVLIVERAPSGSNTRWVCKYCEYNGYSSYTQVEPRLLQIKNKRVGICTKVSFEQLMEMRNEVQRCKELVERAKERLVSMPIVPAPHDSSGTKKSKRRPVSALEETWAMPDHKHLDALIARSFYSGDTIANNGWMEVLVVYPHTRIRSPAPRPHLVSLFSHDSRELELKLFKCSSVLQYGLGEASGKQWARS